MATISALTENFEGGANDTVITTANTIFDNKSGTATVTFNNDAKEGSLSMQVVASAQDAILRADLTASSTLWICYYLKIVSAPSTPTAITNWFSGTTKIGDIRLAADMTIGLRDGNASLWTSSALALNVWHRIAIKVTPNTATGHRIKIYSGANLDSGTASQDSGNLSATAAAVSSVDNVRFGLISADTATLRFDRLRGDDAAEPNGISGDALTVDAGVNQVNIEPYDTVTLSGSVSGGTAPYSYAWTQTGGSPTVTLSGSGMTRTFSAPALLNGTTLTFQLTVTDSASGSGNDSMTVTVYVHNDFTRSGGQWIPHRIRNRQSNTWSS